MTSGVTVLACSWLRDGAYWGNYFERKARARKSQEDNLAESAYTGERGHGRNCDIDEHSVADPSEFQRKP
jgi:hypothetical protein